MNDRVSRLGLLVLGALAASPEDGRHGYWIAEKVVELTAGDSYSLSAIYDALRALEKAGLVERSGEEIVKGRARIYFKITGAGQMFGREQATRDRQIAERAWGPPIPQGGVA